MTETRSLNYTYLLDEILVIATRHGLTILLVYGGFFLPLGVLLALVPVGPGGAAVSWSGRTLWMIAGLAYVLSPLPAAVITLRIRNTLAGSETGLLWLIEETLGRWRTLVGLGLLVGVPTLAGFTPLVLPGLAYLCMFLAALPAVMFEDASVLSAMRRSLELTQGFRFDVFVLLAALVLILGPLVLGAVVVVDALDASGSSPGSLWLLPGLAGLLLLLPVVSTLSYLHLRALQEVDAPEDDPEEAEYEGIDWSDENLTFDLGEEEEPPPQEGDEDGPRDPSAELKPIEFGFAAVIGAIRRLGIRQLPSLLLVFAAFWAPATAILLGTVFPALAFDPSKHDAHTYLILATFSFLSPIPAAALAVAIRDATSGEPISILRCYGATFRRIGTVLLLGFFAGVLPFHGSVFGAVPGFFFLLQLFVVVPVAVIEDRGLGGALARSVWLTRRHRMNLFAVFFCLGMAVLTPLFVVTSLWSASPLPGLGRLSWRLVPTLLGFLFLLGVTQGVAYGLLARIKASQPQLEADDVLYFRFE